MRLLDTSQSSRRVHRVCLSAPDEESVRRGAILLEDALRTASLQEPQGSRLLLVRSLDVGTIDSRFSSASVALTIEQRLRHLASTAVYALDPSAPHQSVVYFHDALEAYIHLAVSLAQGQSVMAWFWPLAVPQWSPHVSRDEALRQIVLTVAQMEAGAGAVATLLQIAAQHQALSPLLSTLRSLDGPTLFRLYGWFTPTIPLALVERPVPTRFASVSAQAAATLSEWIDRWGAEDLRTVWLAAHLLSGEQPTRLMGTRLMMRSQQLIKHVIAQSATSCEPTQGLASFSNDSAHPAFETPPPLARADGEAPGEDRRSPTNQNRQVLEERETPPVIGSTAAIAPPSSSSALSPDDRQPTETTPPPSPAKADSSETVAAPMGETTAVQTFLHDVPEPADAANLNLAPTAVQTSSPTGAETVDNLQAAGAEPPGETPPVSPLDSPAASQTAASSPATASLSTGTPDDAEAEAAVEPLPEFSPPAEVPSRLPYGTSPLPTAWAGFFFLIPLLNQLGFSEFLHNYPDWIEADLPLRLLRRIALRLSMPMDDPIGSVLDDMAGNRAGDVALSAMPPWEVVMPSRWRDRVANPGRWQVQNCGDGWRVLWDGSGRLPLAGWSGQAPEAVRALIGDRPLQRYRLQPSHAAVSSPDILSLVLQAWQTAMRRWCRRYAHHGLHSLVQRPGKVAATPTHIDLLMTHHQADVRIRLAGLDIDPGWVPWLGRVVLFHYYDGE